MSQNSDKNTIVDKSNIPKASERDKMYSLQSFINKINKSETSSFGNYFVDLGEMFPDSSEYQGYMKKKVSITNDDTVEKKALKNNNSNFFLKPQYFSKFSNETLFYIFYYMTRDTLQLLSSEELYKRKWRYNTDYAIWFTQDTEALQEKNKEEAYLYFNPNEWKVMKYTFSPLNPKAFLSENEMFKYSKQPNTEK